MSDDSGERGWLGRLWPLLVAALLGGTGGAGIKEVVVPSRPDPHTGADASRMEVSIRRDMQRCEVRVEKLETLVADIRLDLAHLPPRDLVGNVTKNSADIRSMRESIAPWVRLHPSPNDMMRPGRPNPH